MEVTENVENDELININEEFNLIDELFRECLQYLQSKNEENLGGDSDSEEYLVNKNEEIKNETEIEERRQTKLFYADKKLLNDDDTKQKQIILDTLQFENELNQESYDDKSCNSNFINIFDTGEDITLTDQDYDGIRSERLRKFSKQLPRIVITGTDGKNTFRKFDESLREGIEAENWIKNPKTRTFTNRTYSKRRITKNGTENVALISNIPFEKMRLLNDAFHTLINIRWRWIIVGTVLVHFGIWLIFACFWYITALAHYDLGPDPPSKMCITGGKDFLNIFLASVEAQTTIGFGDRTIDEECPESIFLFIMQLIMGTGLSGVLTCVVYAKLARPETFAKQGVGFSRNAAISMRDGRLCLVFRIWDLNYDHIISTEINAYFIKTIRTKEGEVLKHYALSLPLVQRQLMLWPVSAVHVISSESPLYDMNPEDFINTQYEITVTLKGASASMGTYTQSQTSYLPREVLWGYRFASVVKYSDHEQKYTIDHKHLDTLQEVETPLCSSRRLAEALCRTGASSSCSGNQSFVEKLETFARDRPSSFNWKNDSFA